jgi:hypothetical protein
MDRDEQQGHLLSELRNLVNRFSVEYDKLNYMDYFGAFMDVIIDLKLEQKYNTPIEWSDDGEYEEYENEDDEDGDYEDGEEWKADQGSD